MRERHTTKKQNGKLKHRDDQLWQRAAGHPNTPQNILVSESSHLHSRITVEAVASDFIISLRATAVRA